MDITDRRLKKREDRTRRREERRRLNEPPARSLAEEIANAVSHGTGALLSAAGLILMLLRSDAPREKAAASVYGGCLVLLFTMSCLYHAFPRGTTVKRVWRRFDYCSIYLLIGGSFTPLFLLYMGGAPGFWMCLGQWLIISAGIALVGVFGPAPLRKLHFALYILLGWSALFLLPGIARDLPALLWYLLAGGLAYTLGIIPFTAKTRGSHFLWHLFVILGAALHWCGFCLYLF
ncbi:MAG: hemolysin III family protein [Clostridia bacterium]|nr:hemolysin III family protein [Clostridia bacterium]